MTFTSLYIGFGPGDRIFEYRFIQSSSYSFPVTNVELEYMFYTLGFLWLHMLYLLLYLLGKLIDGLSDDHMRPPRSTTATTTTTTTTLYAVVIGMNQSSSMDPENATDVCDGCSKHYGAWKCNYCKADWSETCV